MTDIARQRTGLFKTHRRRDFLILYTLIFALLSVLTHIYIYISGRTLVWNLDGSGQHIKALAFYGEWLRGVLRHIFADHELSIPSWSFSIGYGADVPVTLSYYVTGDPFAILSVFVPVKYTYFLYEALIYLRVWCMGLTFATFCFGRNRDAAPYAVLASSFVYSFCGFAMHNTIRHPFFLTPMVFLPLVLLGAQYVIDRRKPWLLIVSVFLAAVSNFYFFYMIALVTVLYVGLMLFVPFAKDKFKDSLAAIGRVALFAATGVLLSGFLLYPAFLLILGNSRTGADHALSLLYPLKYYESFLSSFLTFYEAEGGEWTTLGYSAPALVAVALLYFGRRADKVKLRLRVAFAVLTVFLLIPAVQLVFNGFTYPSARWHFAYGFLVAYILVCMWPELIRAEKRKLIYLATFLGIYAVLCMVFPHGRNMSVIVSLVLAMALALGLNLTSSGTKMSGIREKAVLLTVSLSVVINSAFMFIPSDSTFMKELAESANIDELIYPPETEELKAVAAGDGFWRFSYFSHHDANACNDAMLSGMGSTGTYLSFVPDSVTDYMKLNEVDRKSDFRFSDPDRRTFLLALAGVKYAVLANPAEGAPYGYEQVSDNICVNNYALPLGITYSAVIPEDKYLSMTPAQRQEAMLQGVCLEGYEGSLLSEGQVTLTSSEVPCEITPGSGVYLSGNSFFVTKPYATATITFAGKPSCETYLDIKGFAFTGTTMYRIYKNNPDMFDWNALTAEEQKAMAEEDRYYTEPEFVMVTLNALSPYTHELYLESKSYSRYSGRDRFFINMGYSDAARSMMTMTFPEVGIYSFEEISAVLQPMDGYAAEVTALKEETAEGLDLHTSGNATCLITGSITVSEDKILVLQIPYSEGWSAYLDGEKVSLYRANTMYMGLEVPAGTHTFELRYVTPGAGAGALMTAAGLLLCAAYAAYGRTSRKPSKK